MARNPDSLGLLGIRATSHCICSTYSGIWLSSMSYLKWQFGALETLNESFHLVHFTVKDSSSCWKKKCIVQLKCQQWTWARNRIASLFAAGPGHTLSDSWLVTLFIHLSGPLALPMGWPRSLFWSSLFYSLATFAWEMGVRPAHSSTLSLSLRLQCAGSWLDSRYNFDEIREFHGMSLSRSISERDAKESLGCPISLCPHRHEKNNGTGPPTPLLGKSFL